MSGLVIRSEHVNIISLCTGGGGLDLGVELAMPSARTICMLERESFCIANLVAAMQQGLLAQAPIWSDVRTFSGRPWRDLVDGIIGGIPCQAHSVAGKKLGQLDERDLWSATRRIIVQCRPRFVVIENVSGMLSAGADEIAGAERVWRDLQKLGFKVEGGLFTAAEVGAPHGRERIFILAVADCDHQHDYWPRKFGARWWGESADCGSALADASDTRLQGRELSRSSGERIGTEASRSTPELCRTPLVDSPSVGWGEGRTEPAVRSGRNAVAVPGGTMGDTISSGYDGRSDDSFRGSIGRDAAEGAGCGAGGEVADASGERGRPVSIQPRRQDKAGANVDGEGEQLADAGSAASGRDTGAISGTEGAISQEWQQHGDMLVRPWIGRAAVANSDITQLQRKPSAGQFAQLQRDDALGIFPPGPGDEGAWQHIIELAPERLPALSRYDRFSLAIREAIIAAYGDPSAREGLDEKSPYGLHPSVVQKIAQSHLRRMDDGLAGRLDETRIDELRALGNGVVPLQAALAFRTLAHRLADRGSIIAARLVRMMVAA